MMCSYPIPAALEHGDFWPSNVLISGTDYAYLDWSDSSLAHPFFSLTLFLEHEGIPPALAQLPDLATMPTWNPGPATRLQTAFLQLSSWHKSWRRCTMR